MKVKVKVYRKSEDVRAFDGRFREVGEPSETVLAGYDFQEAYDLAEDWWDESPSAEMIEMFS